MATIIIAFTLLCIHWFGGRHSNVPESNFIIGVIQSRSYKRSETLFKSLLFWLAGEVSWLAVEVLSPCRK